MSETKTDMTIPETIREQLGGKSFAIMTGSKNFTGSKVPETASRHNSLTFQLSKNHSGGNYMRITLNTRDEYDVSVFKVCMSGKNIGVQTVKHELSGIYCDQLQEVFRTLTGLETRMPRFASR